MNTALKSFISRVKKASFFIPFTAYFLAFVFAVLLLKKAVTNDQLKQDNSFSDIFSLLIKVSGFFAGIVLALSFLFVLISWIHFLYWKKKTGILLNIETNNAESDNQSKQAVYLTIKPIWKPLFGFIRIRLYYDYKKYSGKFSLVETGGGKALFSNTLSGVYHWNLPQIKEYSIQKAVIYFEDVFQFFSLASSLPATNRFMSNPVAYYERQENVNPRKTEETNIRIDEMRRVEGELLNYKNFEAYDDVRRIVWKIYAKNKELVVRIPEVMDPYASHFYLYPSYHTAFNIKGNEVVEIPFLNYYKTFIWSLHQSLLAKGFEVKYIEDQDVSKYDTSNYNQWVKHAISGSSWQQDKPLKDFVLPVNAAVVVVSSLSNFEDVKELYERLGSDVRFVFVKLTNSFRQQNVIDWLQWVFVKDEARNMDFYKRKWATSILIREKIKENENKLQNLLVVKETV